MSKSNTDELLADDRLLAKVLASVKLEVRMPMRVRIAKHVKGKLQDSHELDINSTDKVEDLQKEVTLIARRWKGGFEVGTVYTVERVG